MTTSLTTDWTGERRDIKVYGEPPVASAEYDVATREFVLRFAGGDPLGWCEKRCQSLETCDWLALAYACELKATGH